MTIGDRIKLERQKAGLTLRELAALAGVSAQAVSKYERNLDVPGSKVLIRMAQALGVSVEFFLRQKSLSRIEPLSGKFWSISIKDKNAILSRASDWLERYLEIEDILSGEVSVHGFEYPPGFPRAVESLKDAEKAATDLRSAWSLGSGPINNLTDLIESKGIKVRSIDADMLFDACTFQAEDDPAVTAIIVRSDLPGDRQRLSMASELGYLMLRPKGLNEEKADQRFAIAFLVTEAAARLELRGKRSHLSFYELHLLKHKYGLSMLAWIDRAGDLGIISQARAKTLFKTFGSKGCHMQEPDDAIAPEVPCRFERLVMEPWQTS